jgi:hypothetical protein
VPVITDTEHTTIWTWSFSWQSKPNSV